MSNYLFNKKEESSSRYQSAIITAIIWAVILLFVFTYSFKSSITKRDEPQMTTMLINFGDNRNGNGLEEPKEQEGSLSANTLPEEITSPSVKEEPTKTVEKLLKENSSEKIITGKNEKISVKKTEDKKTKKTEKKTEIKATKNTTKASSSKSAETSALAKPNKTKGGSANATSGNGDGQGNAAIGNLIKGKGTKTGSQGTGTGIGNAGDPLGGEGNGDSKIGVDRKLVQFIPGTMGRGGAQPSHKCTASGSINISYTVDKAGHVTSANRISGSSDPCIVQTSENWVRKYVKAEKANFTSKGTYKISF